MSSSESSTVGTGAADLNISGGTWPAIEGRAGSIASRVGPATTPCTAAPASIRCGAWHINEVKPSAASGTTSRWKPSSAIPSGSERISSVASRRMIQPFLAGLRAYHNFMRPHLGLDDTSPSEAAGIQIERNYNILTMIQTAAKSVA